ncbi:MAG: Rieske 2Fe-2S domain-containing protein [Euryarchaeota archaeon]|nr:Rieske 2Fe-2S domain-containing protein [Euryarchaeota archaeon]
MGKPLIDEDIRTAQTLPSAWYTEVEHFNRLKSVFSGWQFAAHKSDFGANNVLPVEHYEAITSESVVLLKGDKTACHSNVCTHRGMRVALDSCTAKTLQCRYHGRTFNLDGTLKHMPEFKEATGFPAANDNLAEFPLQQWMGMYFTALDDFPQLPWAALQDRLGFLNAEEFTHDSSRDRDHTIEANWMLYVDNYLEGFHIPYVHPELNQALDYEGYTTETFEGGVMQIGKAMEGDVKFDLPDGHPDAGQDIAAYYLWLFPNMMFNFYPWGLSLNVVIPVSPTQTRVLYRGYVRDADLASEGAGSLLDTVEEQDQWVIELVQRGMASSVYDRGRYSPTREQGVHHFHRMLDELVDENQ